MRSINKCLTDIKRSTNIAIFTHMAPDADALASALALKKLIKCNNPNCEKIIDLFFDYYRYREHYYSRHLMLI